MSFPTVQLRDLLTEDQLSEASVLIDRIQYRKTPTNDLRAYLISQRESLEARGVLPEYLFYALVYQLHLPL